MSCLEQAFLVVIHDVTPQFVEPIAAILARLTPLIRRHVAAAVVPQWHGQPWTDDGGFAGWVKGHFGEVLLHGCTHHRSRGGSLLSRLIGRADEFAGMPAAAAVERLRCGQAILAEAFGRPAMGFVPPAWQSGPVCPALLTACGLHYCAGLTRIERVGRRPVPLSTWSWDAGKVPQLGLLGEAAGAAMSALRRHSLPCVVFHPRDLDRGYVPRGLTLIETFLSAGRRPVTFAEAVSCRSERPT